MLKEPGAPEAGKDLSTLSIGRDRTSLGRSRGFPWRWLLLAVLILAGLGLWRTGLLSPGTEVRFATASNYYPFQAYTLINASGYVVAQRKAAVGAKITSRLTELLVEEGSRVTQDQVVARLEGADVASSLELARSQVDTARAAIDEARARLSDAELQYRRLDKLYAVDAVAKAELDTARYTFEAAQASLKARRDELATAEHNVARAEVEVEYTEIRAPFDAVVLTKDADVGDILTPLGAASNARASVVTIADMSSLMVEADVAESNIAMVKLRQPCIIQLDALPGERFPGYVHMIVPTADRSKASVMVKAAFEELDPRILPEMSAKVSFLSRSVPQDESEAVLAVPASALVNTPSGAAVFTENDSRARLVPVETGRNFKDFIEIKSGLENGQKVIVAPPEGLEDGDRVKAAV